MVRSRQLFLRSRLELAAELEQNAPDTENDDSYRQLIYILSLLFINLPFAFFYGPTYLFVKLAYGEAAADRYTPESLLKTKVPNEDNEDDDEDDKWNGRMREQDKRTKARIEPVLTKMSEMQTKMDELQAKVDRIQAENKQMQAENKQMQAESEARMKQMQAENEARMKQMQAENEASTKETQRKLDAIFDCVSKSRG